MYQLSEGLLREGADLKVLALEPVFPQVAYEGIPTDYAEMTGYETWEIDNRVKPLHAFLNLFTRRSYNISRFYSGKVERRLREILNEKEFDIIQLEGLYLTPYIPVIRECSAASLLFRSHNIEHFIWERRAAGCRNPFKKAYLRLLARRLKSYEMRTVHQVDGLIAISGVDLRFFKQHGFSHPALTIPVGIDDRMLQKGNMPAERNTVFHIGSMDWKPNQEGILWFMEEVWPLVIRENPSLCFVLAGRNIPPSIYRHQSQNISIVGEVPDAPEFMSKHELMVVPLRSGGGMRVKIIEAMAAGKAIVSTSIGAEGIHCSHGENILLADTAREIADAILHSFDHRDGIRQMGEKAQAFAKEQHGMEGIMKKLMSFYGTFIEKQ